MKLDTARIRNFKLLRHIDLNFSTDRNLPLTVVRAENGSGKTSCLQALRWGLYGAAGLEDPTVRLSPADWPENEPCPISVEIDFTHTLASIVGDQTITTETRYMIRREVVERPSGNQPNREPESVNLYERRQSGAKPIEGPAGRIAQMLPAEMLDIFFTDGDAAMTFISPQLAESTKRDQVKEAIRSLLGLGLLESIDQRIQTGIAQVRRQIARQAGADDLAQVSTELQDTEDQRAELTKEISGLNQQIENLNKKLAAVKRDLQRALEAGSYELLAHQRDTYQKQLDAARERDEALKKRHQTLFAHEFLSLGMLAPQLQKGHKLLDDLNAQGVIPKAAVPVLKERLALKVCICGADLTDGTDARTHVLSLIEQQRDSDAQTEHLSSLFYQAKSTLEGWESEETKWPTLIDDVTRDRLATNQQIKVANRELRSVLAKIDEIDQEEIERKRSLEKSYEASLLQKNNELNRREISIGQLDEKLTELKRKDAQLRRDNERVAGLNAQLSVLDDLQTIVGGTLNEMQGTYLNRVSDRMNELFLDMIGADPNQGAIYQGVRITPQYSIVVETKDDRTLNPDHEVNGASQRALTFAFIWALTEVSGVVAPRAIDSPLGIMSGNVKKRVLSTVSASAGDDEIDRQVVLFLTQSEIANTQEILDKKVGAIVTLTKTDDYPADLVNDPEALQPEIRLCACNHRQYCVTCQRNNAEDFALQFRP